MGADYPASGVGMNFCLQDAINLGWKLAAAVAGRAPPWLLDSYEAERLPEIQKLLDDVRRQCAIQFNFDPGHVALKRFFERDLLAIPEVNRRICENLSGFSVRYPVADGSHDIVGRRLGGAIVFELLRAQKFVLLGSAPEAADGVALVVAPARLDGPRLVLLRPDGYVAWAGEDLPDAEAAVRTWLNIPPGRPVFGKQGRL